MNANKEVTHWINDTDCADELEDNSLYLWRLVCKGIPTNSVFITSGDAIKALVGPVPRAQILFMGNFMSGYPIVAPEQKGQNV